MADSEVIVSNLNEGREMKAQKVELKINVQVLDIASAKGLLFDLANQLDREVESGMLRMSDGDQVVWITKRTDVDF